MERIGYIMKCFECKAEWQVNNPSPIKDDGKPNPFFCQACNRYGDIKETLWERLDFHRR